MKRCPACDTPLPHDGHPTQQRLGGEMIGCPNIEPSGWAAVYSTRRRHATFEAVDRMAELEAQWVRDGIGA